jgi:nicotinamide phosphoribosyltransferase
MNPIFYIDFYKVGHVSQYAPGTKQVWSNWTARSSRTGRNSVVFFGLQYFIKKILIEEFDKNFFGSPWELIESEYREVIKKTLGVDNPKTDHIKYLHDLGYLPLDIYALPEGVTVPIRVPSVVVTNTDDNCYWLPNYIESVMSAYLWKPSTSATTAQQYRKLFVKHALRSGETDLGFIDWQGHDFSMRGMSGLDDVILSGMGHLTSFNGTDSVPAILAAHDYYGADYSCGGSVPATEHSVMCSGGKEGELETFRRLIEDVYPTGIVSVVSDTWDLWKVLTEYIPQLRDKILARDGKIVIRPDSGDPVKIICGDKDAPAGSPANQGTLRLLENVLGTNYIGGNPALSKINKAGAIYGDAITIERADQILTRIIDELKLSPYNMVFGIGSYTYEYVTRDTYGHAMKATAVRNGTEVIPIFKDPKTDDGVKKSLKGIPAVYRKQVGMGASYNYEQGSVEPYKIYGDYYVEDMKSPKDLDNCDFVKVYSNGNLLVDHKFDDIRKRVRS